MVCHNTIIILNSRSVAWIVVILIVGLPPYLKEYGTQNIGGFCIANFFSVPYIGMAVSLTVGATIFLHEESSSQST